MNLCIGVNCKNPESYGTICVKCNMCGRFDKPKQTNADRIRAELKDDRKLAELLIRSEHEPDYEYNYEEELEYWGETDYYITPNGERFGDFEEAVTETLDWLKQEVEEHHEH